jgi:hypothetical protein
VGISKLSTGLSLERLEPATSVRTAETSSPNKDGDKDSPNQDSGNSDSARHDSANQDGESYGEEGRLGRPVSEPDSSPEASADGNENVSAEPPHKIDSLA